MLKKKLSMLRNIVYGCFYSIYKYDKYIIDSFHMYYYNEHIYKKTMEPTLWLGVPIQKCPLDCWIYQEIIFNLKPDIIIETGTADGGSAYFMASLLDILNKGKVVSVDIENKENRPRNKRIQYLTGSSISDSIIRKLEKMISPRDRVMVILDSDHSKNHVLSELKLYTKFVTKGSYLIVEDTNINGHPAYSDFGPGPMEAVEEFMKKNMCYKIDRDWEKFFITFNPGGYLLKIK